MMHPDTETLFTDPVERARIQTEAEFGLHEMEAAIMALPAGAHVLEIGCGTGYLLATLSSLRPDLSFTGLEPIGKGFAAFEATLTRIETAYPNLSIHRAGIEDFRLPKGAAPFDLVFSVNVFEHVQDWRRAVLAGADLLSPAGQMTILCPNYAVPYEPHFRIPVLLSASLTRRVFARHIEKVETEIGAQGLWTSLNFISVPAVRRHCRTHGLVVTFDTGVMARMLLRLDTDPEFARRQAAVAGVARLLRRSGAGWLLQRIPAAFSPYMKAVIRR